MGTGTIGGGRRARMGYDMTPGGVGYDRERLIGLLQRDALRRGTFTLASGRTSHYYVDGRKVTLSAAGRR